jgi:hypothetical protein
MGNDSLSAKSVLQKFTPERWAAIRTAYPGIEDVLRRTCNIFGQQPIFEESGKPTALLTVRLQALKPQGAAALLEVINVFDGAADDAATDDDEKGTESREDTERPSTDGDLAVVPQPQAMAELAIRLDSLQRLIVDLRERQGQVLGAVDRIRARVELGKPGAVDDIVELTCWQEGLVEAADLVAIAGEDLSLSRLDAEAVRVQGDLQAASRDAPLASLIADIASVQVTTGREALAAPIAWGSALATATMTDEDKSLVHALHRVMAAPATTNVDDGDAGKVMTAFGMPALLSAVGALASENRGAESPEGDVEPPVSQQDLAEPPFSGNAPPPAEFETDLVSDAVSAENNAVMAHQDAPAAQLESFPGEVSQHTAETAPPPELIFEIAADQVPEAPAPVERVPSPDTVDHEASAVSGASEDEVAVHQATDVETTPDPRLAAALRDGRPGLAYWYSVALHLPEPVQSAFELLALSKAVTADGDEPSSRIREILGGYKIDLLGQGSDYTMVLAAGSARALLHMPFSACSDVLYAATERIGPGWEHDFLRAVLEAGAFGFDLARVIDVRTQGLDDLIAQRDEAVSRLNAARNGASNAGIKYLPAVGVLRQIMKDQGAVGSAVSAINAARDNPTPAERLLGELRDQKAVDRLIDEIHLRLNPVAARKSKIIAGAREQLRARIDDVLAAMRQYLEATRTLHSRRQAGGPEIPTLAAAVQGLKKAANLTGDGSGEACVDLGSLAVAQVRDWTRDALERGSGALAATLSPIETDLARAFEVDRFEDGTADPHSVTLELLETLTTRSAQNAYDGFAAADDFPGIDRLIDTLRAQGEPEAAQRLADRQPEDRKISRERLRRLAERAERELDLALFTALLSESQSADLGRVIARYRNPDADDFLAARRQLDDIILQVEAARARVIDEARAQLGEFDCSNEVRTRITRQLDDGDLVTAQEFLAQLKAGSSELPDEAATDTTFEEFWPAFVEQSTQIAVDGPGVDGDWIERVAAAHTSIAGRQVLPPDSAPTVSLGLTGWRELAVRKRNGAWERWLKEALALIGFEVRGSFDHGTNRSPGRWASKFTAKLVGRALVPAYGTFADGRYQLLLCWGKQTAERVVEMVEELQPQSPVIVLAFTTLSLRDRRTLAEHARKKGTSAVVIDQTVMAFLATQVAARLQTTMSLTLPFTAINPYTPFVLGDVPREVFYGRRNELRDVQDANGPLFVYGGRQLGKSTLLKTAKREFEETAPDWKSVYVDLKAEGIGELRGADDLWPVLVPRLQQAGIIERKVSAKASRDVVVTAIRNWLDADKNRRVLLLLDEADAFLEDDARARKGQVRESRFINVYQLKNLMDGSSRRFKPVFAGLHQVQRFHSVSNGPMGHVGSEILIGPLSPSEAYKLVVEPFAAIGYRFERPDIVWRLLAYTNYQASLVQAFCNALVRRLHSRERLAHGAPPTIITDRDIEEVYGDREVRDWIASRFELTINLDNRYRVIAYATAMMTNEYDRPVFAVSTLLDECKTFWRAGFQDLNLDDFSAYLDEMVGLGVLVRTTGDQYGIRSPNVIRLLGSPTEIERRLMESEDALEVSSVFDPAVFRRKIGVDPDRRSPLTERQVQQVLEGRNRLHIIVGSTALNLDRVAEALTVAKPEDIEIHEVTCQSVNDTVTSLARLRSGRQHVILDLATGSEQEQRAAIERLRAFVDNSERRSASCLAGPSADWLRADDSLTGDEFPRVHLQLWNQDTLRAWAPECQYPLSTTDQRRAILDATGGWPLLVEKAAGAARDGLADPRARQEALKLLDEKREDFLASVGIPDDPITSRVLGSLVEWTDEISFDELATLSGIASADLLDQLLRLVNLGVVSNVSSSDSYRVNSLVARLLRDH